MTETQKAARARYTLACKQEAVRLVESGQSMAAAARAIGIAEQSLFNWGKAQRQGRWSGIASRRGTGRGTEGDQPAASRTGASQEGARPLGKSDGVLRPRPAVQYALIRQHRPLWPIRVPWRVLGVSVAGQHEPWRRRRSAKSRRPLREEALFVQIRAIYAGSRGAYGWPRIGRELKPKGHSGRQAAGATTDAATRHSCWREASFPRHNDPEPTGLAGAEKLLNRQFTVSGRHQVWAGEINYIDTNEGWLSLAVVLELCNRQVIGWALADDLRQELVIDALQRAWFRRALKGQAGLLFPSDRGSQ